MLADAAAASTCFAPAAQRGAQGQRLPALAHLPWVPAAQRDASIGRWRYHRGMITSQAAPAGLAARLFRGFADPTRIAILLALLGGERRVSDLVDVVGGSQSNVSGHLACLKQCGLVLDRPGERRQVFYRLARPEVVDLLQAAERLLAATGTAIALCPNPLMTEEGTDG